MPRKDPYYIEIYITWMYLIFLYLVPFTLLAVFNILIFRSRNIMRTMIIRCNSYHLVCREVRRANKIRAQLSRNQKREIGFTQSAICLFLFFSSQNRCPYWSSFAGLAIMLFCVVIVFFCCNFLALVVNILEVEIFSLCQYSRGWKFYFV